MNLSLKNNNDTNQIFQNINQILDREKISNEIKNILNTFDSQCKNVLFKKGIYIYGSPGSGKTQFVVNLLKEMDYDIIKYDAGDIRNKVMIDTITNNIRTINKVLNTHGKTWLATPAWSIFNLHRIKDFMEYFHKNDLLPYGWYLNNYWENEFHGIIMMKPEFYCVSNASRPWKKYLKKQLKEYKEYYGDVLVPLKVRDIRDQTMKEVSNHVDRFINVIDDESMFDKEHFLRTIKKLDNLRETNFKETFPELKWLLNKKSTLK